MTKNLVLSLSYLMPLAWLTIAFGIETAEYIWVQGKLRKVFSILLFIF